LKKTDNQELVNIGRAGSAVGLKGEFRVTLYAQDSDNLKEGKVLLLKREYKKSGSRNSGNAGSQNSADITRQEICGACAGVRMQNGTPIIKIEGVQDRTAAESLKGLEIYINADDLEELPAGEHYVRDLIGYTVRDIAGGEDIGELNDVIQNTAQSILDVRTPEGKQVLIPAVDAFMRGIDDEAGVISVELIPGFL
jgi:16S rRNA processing protein RimM